MNLWGTVVASGGRVPPGVWMMLAVVNLVVTVLTWSGARRRMRRAGERAADSQLVAGGAARTRDTAVLAAGVEREILWRLHTGPQGATVRQIGLADSRLTHLASTIRWIRAHYNETLRIQDLAALATMSVSSFHRHFRAMTSMTPVQFQKQIRLHEARARLLAEPADVTGAGQAVGYADPSQFSREYRRMFGTPPSRDARSH